MQITLVMKNAEPDAPALILIEQDIQGTTKTVFDPDLLVDQLASINVIGLSDEQLTALQITKGILSCVDQLIEYAADWDGQKIEIEWDDEDDDE